MASKQDIRPAQQRGLYGSEVSGNAARVGVAEAVGTFILVYAGTAVATGALLQRPTAGTPYDSLSIALAFGVALAAMAAALGHVSGAHLNPAVTLGLASTGRFPWRFVPVYLLAQFAGAILGSLATWATYGRPAREQALLAATFPAEGVSAGRGLFVEALITFILVFVVVSVATDDRVPSALAALAVGFALAVGVLIGGPVTGGGVNPARSLGPMLVAGRFEAFWIYLVGPVLGGVAAALLYGRLLAKAKAPES